MRRWKFWICPIASTCLSLILLLLTYDGVPTCARVESVPNDYYPIYSLQDSGPKVYSTPKNLLRNIKVTVSNRHLCDHPLRVVFIVHSHPSNAEQRDYMRTKYFSQLNLDKLNASLLFVMARSSTTDDKVLEEEAREHNDLLQIDMPESYHTITQKARCWIAHLHRSCSSLVKYVVKLDDDVMMDLSFLDAVLLKFTKQKHIVAGKVYPAGIVTRNPHSKWYLSREEYRPSSLGLYCQGMAYIFSGDLIETMFSNIAKVQYLWMDDWYVTHALLNGSSALFVDIGQHYLSVNSDISTDSLIHRYSKSRILFSHFRPPEKFNKKRKEEIWERLQQLNGCR